MANGQILEAVLIVAAQAFRLAHVQTLLPSREEKFALVPIRKTVMKLMVAHHHRPPLLIQEAEVAQAAA